MMQKRKDVQHVLFKLMSEILQFIDSFDRSDIYADNYESILTITTREGYEELQICYYLSIYNRDEELEDPELGRDRLIDSVLSGETEITACSIKFWIEYEEYKRHLGTNNTIRTYPYSTSNMAIGLCRLHYTLFGSMPNYRIGAMDDSYCSSDIEYKYVEIDFKLSEHPRLVSFFNKVKSNKNLLDTGIRPIVFNYDKIVFRASKSDRNIPFVLTNTKSRRLGYFKAIIELFEKGSYYPVSLFPVIAEKELTNLKEQLDVYQITYGGNNKGLIKVGYRGNSAAPYIEVLKNLNIITDINRSYVLTKQAKPYFQLNSEFKSKESSFWSNTFDLNQNDCLYFLQTLLSNDIIYTGLIVYLARSLGDEFSSKEMYNHFQGYLQTYLKHILIILWEDRRKEDIQAILERISLWQKPERYAEHIIEPRVNWLLDLKLIKNSEDKKGYYRFTEAGERFINILAGLEESYSREWLDNLELISISYYSCYAYIYDISFEKKWSLQVVSEYLRKSMNIFKTDAPQRIAASQAINYVCSECLLNHGLLYDFYEIKEYLLSKESDYSLDWFNTENDGSLSIKQHEESRGL
jgi:hypothetical protein